MAGLAGFSLLEMLVVMAIMGALLAVVVPVLGAARVVDGGLAAVAVVDAQVVRARDRALVRGEETALVVVDWRGERRLAVVSLAGGQAQVLGRLERLPGGVSLLDQAGAAARRAAVVDVPERLELVYQGERLSGPYVRFDRRGVVVHPAPPVLLDLLVAAPGLAGYERVRIGRLTGGSWLAGGEEFQ